MIFGPKVKSKWPPSLWLVWHFLWNSWTEFAETWQEARTQHSLPSLCFSGRSENQDWRPSLWLAEMFWTNRLEPLNAIWCNLTRSKYSMSSTKFVLFQGSHSPCIWGFFLENEFVLGNSMNLGDLSWNLDWQSLNFLFCVFWTESLNRNNELKLRFARHSLQVKYFSSSSSHNSRTVVITSFLSKENPQVFMYIRVSMYQSVSKWTVFSTLTVA